MSEQAIARGEAQARNGAILDAAARRRAMRNPETNRILPDQELPEEFIGQAIARMESLLRLGNWEHLRELVDVIKSEWELRQREQQPIPQGALLATPVVRLGLDVRTTNLIQDVCAGTVGALLEAFPAKFANVRNCGSVTVKRIAKALVDIGALSPEEASERVTEWEACA